MTHYETLGVSRDATPEKIHEAYRLIAKRTHPQNTGNDKKLLVIFVGATKAYKAIRLPEDRKKYDLELQLAENPPMQNPVVKQASQKHSAPQKKSGVLEYLTSLEFFESMILSIFLCAGFFVYIKNVEMKERIKNFNQETELRKSLGCEKIYPEYMYPGDKNPNIGCRETPVHKRKYTK